MAVKVGTAPDSWGVWFPSDPKQIPWSRFLDEVVESGYEWTELGPYGYLPTDLPTLNREMKQRNLHVAGGFVMPVLENPDVWPELERQLLGAGQLLAGMDAHSLVLIDDVYSDLTTSELIAPRRLDDDAWNRLVDTTHRAARLCREKLGLRLVFHPHAESHVEYEEQIERFLSDTDPALVNLCLDTGHHAYRGGEPIAFMRKHHHRIEYLHLKSVDAEKQKEVEAKGTPFATAVGEGMFCDPSRGVVDFAAFGKLLRELNYDGFAIVEQDMYPAPFDKPLPIAVRTRAYLREVGIG